jgi:hypothetical protein
MTTSQPSSASSTASWMAAAALPGVWKGMRVFALPGAA